MRNSKVVDNIEALVGETPLFHPKKWLASKGHPDAKVYLKIEGMNVSGSVKDRAALGMILDMEERGLLNENSTIVEATSGNIGISLAAIAAARGYKTIFVMPESMSEERRKFLGAYGAQIVLTPASEGMGGENGAVKVAARLADEIEGAVLASQFTNPANPKYHYETTGPEIWTQTEKDVDVLAVGVGSAGTISGAGKYLKEQNADIEVVGFEPDTSAVLSGEKSGSHGIQGIGTGFVPGNYDEDLVDKVLKVSTDESYELSREFVKSEGIFVGISSGAALAGVLQLLENSAYEGKTIVSVLPDSGDRYLSTDLVEVNLYENE